MAMHSYWDGRNQIFYDTLRYRVVDVRGPGLLVKVNLALDILDVTNDPVGWASTIVEAGAGETELNGSPTSGFIGRITCAGNENDGGQYQAPGQLFRCVSGDRWYAGLQFTADEATQVDLLFGVCNSDTTLLAGLADGAYMETLDGGTGISVVAEKNTSETQTDSMGTMTTSSMIWEMVWDGTNLDYYIDGALVKSISSGNIPDDEALRVSVEFLNGEVAAHTLDIGFLRGFAWAP